MPAWSGIMARRLRHARAFIGSLSEWDTGDWCELGGRPDPGPFYLAAGADVDLSGGPNHFGLGPCRRAENRNQLQDDHGETLAGFWRRAPRGRHPTTVPCIPALWNLDAPKYDAELLLNPSQRERTPNSGAESQN